MLSKKPGKLGKMKMPMDKGAESDLDMQDLQEGEPSPDEEAGMEDMGDMSKPSPEEGGDVLMSASDEELIAEMKKRGLKPQDLEHGGAPGEEDQYAPM